MSEVDPTPVALTRRSFLAGTGAAALSGLVLPSIFPRYALATPQDPGQGDVLVLVFLRGGADGLSMVPPITDAGGYGTLRGAVAVPPPGQGSPRGHAIDLGDTHPHEAGGHTFGFHPAMAGTPEDPSDPDAVGTGGLKAVWDAGHLAVVHAVGFADTSSTSRSHFDAQDHWDRASGDQAVTSGWLARHLAQLAPPADDVAGLAWGTNVQASLVRHRSVASATSLASLSLGAFRDAGRASDVLHALYPATSGDLVVAQGGAALHVLDVVAAADPLQHDPGTGLYPSTALGSGLKQIAMVIRAGIGLRVACIDVGAWDLHNGMGTPANGMMRNLVLQLSDALHAFHQDLSGDFGKPAVLDEVTTVALSEFGRTINVNGNGGTDHGRGNALFVMGSNVVPGLHGDYPEGSLRDGPLGDLEVRNDFRTVLAELLVKRLGDPALDQVLPGFAHPGDLGVFTS